LNPLGVTENMQVGVGSENPVKIRATERAFDTIDRETQVDGVDVESGVSEQPVGDDETIQGAKNRAQDAIRGHDIGIGIEGGVADGPDGLSLIMWAAATDGHRLEIGCGPRLRLPEQIATQVRAGRELGPVMDEVIGESNVARNQGAAGALTGGIVDRESALRHALAGAVGPFVTDLYE
jgi:inosine/xanthosine triphosphatase